MNVYMFLAVVAKNYIWLFVLQVIFFSLLFLTVLLGVCLSSSILYHICSNEVKKRGNSRKDECPTRIDPQYEQGILVDA